MEQGLTASVTGIDEVLAGLTKAPKQIVASAYLKALDAGSQVIVRELWPRVPINQMAALNKAHGGKGAIIGKLDAFITLDSQLRGGAAEVGFGDLGHIALWVEYGHKIVGRKPKGVSWAKHRESASGEVKAHPFMRPAADAAAERAIDAFAGSVASYLKSAVF